MSFLQFIDRRVARGMNFYDSCSQYFAQQATKSLRLMKKKPGWVDALVIIKMFPALL